MIAAKKVINLHQPEGIQAQLLNLKRRLDDLENQSRLIDPGAHLIVPTDSGYLFLDPQKITHCTAANSSCIIHLENQKICISRTLKWVSDQLHPVSFIRVHSSHLINTRAVQRYKKGSNTIIELKSGKCIPVSRSYRKQVELFFNL